MASQGKVIASVLVGVFVAVLASSLRELNDVESVTWWFSGRSISYLWGNDYHWETHPPLYYTFAWAARQVGGGAIEALRVPSIVAHAMAVLVVGHIAREVIPRTAPGANAVYLFCAVAFALHPTAIEFAAYARMYSFVGLAGALVLYGCTRLANELDSHATLAPFRATWPSWCSITAGLVLALHMHNAAAVVLGIPALAWGLGLLIMMPAGQRVNGFLMLSACAIATLLLWANQLTRLLVQFSHVQKDFWLAPPNLKSILWVWDFSVGSSAEIWNPFLRWSLAGFSLAATAAGLVTLVRWRRRVTAFTLGLFLFSPLAFAFIVSHTIVPVFLDRLLWWIVVPALVLVSVVLAAIPGCVTRNFATIATLLSFGALTTLMIHGWGTEPHFQPASLKVEGIAAEETAAVVIPAILVTRLNYHRAQSGLAVTAISVPEFPTVNPARQYPGGNEGTPRVDLDDTLVLKQQLLGFKAVWLRTYKAELWDPDELVLNSMKRWFGPPRITRRAGQSSVYLFKLQDHSEPFGELGN